jgi:adenosine/AMP kinase
MLGRRRVIAETDQWRGIIGVIDGGSIGESP